jgi:hypothetical protein
MSVVNNYPVIEEIEVDLESLPPYADRFSIVHISDIHLGPTAGLEYLKEIVTLVNDLKPDLIAITGNIADFSYSLYYDPLSNVVEKFKARYGVFFVTGNSDYWGGGAETWSRLLHFKGIFVLRNFLVPIKDGNNQTLFDLAGVDDWYSGSFYSMWGKHPGPKLKETLSTSTSKPIILLAHNPNQFYESHSLKVDLQLSGHNLGGQIFPLHILLYPFQSFFSGLYIEDHSVLYVSRGLGYWYVPMRLFAQPEITKITLRSRKPNYDKPKEDL